MSIDDEKIKKKQKQNLLQLDNSEQEEFLYCDVCDKPVCVIKYSKKVVHKNTPECNRCGCGIDATGVTDIIFCMNCRGGST